MNKSKNKLKSDKLNIGCGKDIRQGYLNLDVYKFEGVDMIWDIDKFPWPFQDNSFAEIIMSHVLEHVDDVVKTIKEVWRVSKPDALIKISVPYYTGLNAVKDPTHKHLFCAGTFDFFEKGKLNNYFDSSTKFNFRIRKRTIVFSKNKLLKIINPIINLNQKAYERFFSHLLPAEVLEVALIAKK